MGYNAPKRVYRLVFEDPDFEGLEVRCRAINLGKLLGLQELASLAGKSPEEMHADDLASADKLFQLFADCLIDWNLEDEDGTPVPPTYDGLMTQELPWINGLIESWMVNTIGISSPLASSSTGGAQFPEALIPQETL